MRRDSVSANAIERPSSLAEYSPREKRGDESIKTTERKSRGDAKSHSPTPGARVTPTYIERTPAMWAVGEVDIRAIGDDSLVANFAFAIGSFLLGFGINILVDYGGMEKLTETGAFMLHKAMPLLFLFAGLFYVIGVVMNRRKNAIWEQIKKESKPQQ